MRSLGCLRTLPECHTLITQDEFNDALTFEQCRWVDPLSKVWTRDGERYYSDFGSLVDTPRHIAFHIWAGYSPLVQWWEIVKEWLKACRDPIKTKTFLNTVLGETYDIAICAALILLKRNCTSVLQLLNRVRATCIFHHLVCQRIILISLRLKNDG